MVSVSDFQWPLKNQVALRVGNIKTECSEASVLSIHSKLCGDIQIVHVIRIDGMANTIVSAFQTLIAHICIAPHAESWSVQMSASYGWYGCI